MNFSPIVLQTNKKKQHFSMSALFVKPISTLFNASMYFKYYFDFILLIFAHDTGEVKH